MSDSDFAIVIATADNGEILSRTLESIEQNSLPSEISQILISDNSPSASARSTVDKFKGRLPISYDHHKVPTKCSSLNSSVNRLADDVFVIFFDDDVRLEKGCLKAYVDTVKKAVKPIFIGGRCSVDYEERPPEWLKPYLPSSATGWTLGNKITPLLKPKAKGFNWGARVADIKRGGGFDEDIGPGTPNPLGDEMYMQKNLLEDGVVGLFVPDARVYHYVPKDKCSPDWTLSRAKLRGYSEGTKIVKQMRGQINSDSEEIKSVGIIRLKFYIAKTICSILPAPIFGRLVFPYRFYSNYFQSCLLAIEEAKVTDSIDQGIITKSSIH
ncbi:MAG: glycosyltransferase family 2 protein [Acidiferrobacterales bacterium]|nr:glycosyltransferase family 2 protein [Acidiferrobacterales bacterium]